MNADAPLDPQDLERLRALAAGRSKAELGALVSGVGAKAMVAALAGLPVRAATRELIRQHLGSRPEPKRYELSGDVECKLCADSLSNGSDGLCATCRLAVNS